MPSQRSTTTGSPKRRVWGIIIAIILVVIIFVFIGRAIKNRNSAPANQSSVWGRGLGLPIGLGPASQGPSRGVLDIGIRTPSGIVGSHGNGGILGNIPIPGTLPGGLLNPINMLNPMPAVMGGLSNFHF